MTLQRSTVLIVGAGISGLATAWNLRQALPQLDLAVWESSSRPGGTAWTLREGNFVLEIGPNGFLDNRPSTLALCQSLGLSDLHRTDLRSADRFLFLGDKLQRIPTTPGEFLRSDILSWKGKLRALAERFMPRRRGEEDESIADFGRRRVGDEATAKILDAVVTGIHAGDSELLSLPATFPRLAEMERDFGSLIRAQGKLAQLRKRTGAPKPGSSLVAPAGGMRTLIETLVHQLDCVEYATPALRVARDAAGWSVQSTEESRRVDAVVLACPASQQARIIGELDRSLADELAAIRYAPAVVASVAFRKKDLPSEPRGFGYLAPQRLGRPVLGVQWSSSVLPGQAPPDQFLFRAILGGWRRGDVLDWEDEAIVRVVLDDLRQTLAITALPTFHFVYRWPQAIPQYHVGHLERLQRIEELASQHPGLFFTGNAFRGVALNDCTADAKRIAEQVTGYLHSHADTDAPASH